MAIPPAPILLWFRLDLRLSDNPALQKALQTGRPIIPIYIWAPEEEHPWEPGAASRVWLHGSLKALDASLNLRGSCLLIFSGKTQTLLSQVLADTGANSVYWNRRYEPYSILRDDKITVHLQSKGVEVQTFNSHLLVEPWELKTQAGTPYRVFTPFWRRLNSLPVPQTATTLPKKIKAPAKLPMGISLTNLKLLPNIPWDKGLHQEWQPGELGAQAKLSKFLHENLSRYSQMRDRPDLGQTARISPHLHFGEISPRQIWHQILSQTKPIKKTTQQKGGLKFLRELAWREFAYHLLFHFPETTQQPLKTKFMSFPWRKNSKDLNKWQQGLTGYPLVDAGMRELWYTGFMHNRVRMLAASFLIKDLRVHWLEGARWFWDTLVDADLANNTLGWQWCAGCGADATPFFRIFNPTTQAKKFDPHGNYIRRWIPELENLSAPDIFSPWQFKINKSEYPQPIVDHANARRETLALFKTLPKGK